MGKDEGKMMNKWDIFQQTMFDYRYSSHVSQVLLRYNWDESNDRGVKGVWQMGWSVNLLVGGAITILKNDGVRQWEWWHPIYEMENKHVPNHQPAWVFFGPAVWVRQKLR